MGNSTLLAREIPLIKDTSKFLSRIKVDISSGCWVWTGTKTKRGYGAICINAKSYPAHRVSWSIFEGNLNKALVLDHTCMNKMCVNPEHLRQVTRAINNTENVINPTSINKSKNVCINGHEFNIINSRKEGNGRRCLICKRERDKKYYARNLGAKRKFAKTLKRLI